MQILNWMFINKEFRIGLSLTATVFLSFVNTTVFALTKSEKEEKLKVIKEIKSRGGTVYAMVPKDASDPFFVAAAKGCMEEAKILGIHCIYYGHLKEDIRVQAMDILALSEAGVDGLAISAIRKGFISKNLGSTLKALGKPILSFDSPLNNEIIHTHIGSDSYQLGRTLGEEINKLKPEGGTFCIQTERPDSPNHGLRMAGIIDVLHDSSDGSSKWKQLASCPLKHMGNHRRATKQMLRTINHYDIDVFIVTGGGAQFLTELYKKSIRPHVDKIKSGELILANIDALPFQLEYLNEGLSTINVGQRPYEMGKWVARTFKVIEDGETPPMLINTSLTICTRENYDTCTQ